jgi:pantoate--beta-alanine ligase
VRVIDTVAAFRKELDAGRARGRTVGLVPTMGYLHDGHGSLIRRAAGERDVTAVTLFVNPLQFAATEDLSTYPRDLERDVAIASAAGADLLFAPPVEQMYPDGVPIRTTVSVAGPSAGYEGASRPTHFAGVATVVAKLFAVAGDCRAYFGEKDFQQLAVIRRMARDLSFPVHVVGCPTVREPDGLAMSSRNVHLSPAHRAAAPVLHRALTAGRDAIARHGERDPAAVVAVVTAAVAAEPLAELDYAAAVRADDLSVPATLSGEVRLLIAARFGSVRLIDNVGVIL